MRKTKGKRHEAEGHVTQQRSQDGGQEMTSARQAIMLRVYNRKINKRGPKLQKEDVNEIQN